MHLLSGGCHCGNIRLRLDLPAAPASYRPRACDCDFCQKHGAAYVSDPQGSLQIHIGDGGQTGRYRQGSGQAEFLLCRRCGVLAAVLYEESGRRYAAANARAVNAGRDFGADQPVSPKALAPGDKSKRWREVWFSEVRLEGLS